MVVTVPLWRSQKDAKRRQQNTEHKTMAEGDEAKINYCHNRNRVLSLADTVFTYLLRYCDVVTRPRTQPKGVDCCLKDDDGIMKSNVEFRNSNFKQDEKE